MRALSVVQVFSLRWMSTLSIVQNFPLRWMSTISAVQIFPSRWMRALSVVQIFRSHWISQTFTGTANAIMLRFGLDDDADDTEMLLSLMRSICARRSLTSKMYSKAYAEEARAVVPLFHELDAR